MMGQVWDADVELSGAQSRALIEAQFPELAPARLVALGAGWDNVAWRVNDDWVFRIPRRRMGADLIEHEADFIPLLAPHLPQPIPVPECFGRPQDDYPYAFLGYRFLPGLTACDPRLSESARVESAPEIALFLSRLHGIALPPQATRDAPGDSIGRSDPQRRLRLMEERIASLDPSGADARMGAMLELARELAGAPPWTGVPCWVHGDLYARHLLFDGDGQLCGVIDWGDVHRGDPALDLSIAWSFLPRGARAEFRESYCDVTFHLFPKMRLARLRKAFDR
jgi:aminoglycoside phosphotransferase (APT) family kinase protein